VGRRRRDAASNSTPTRPTHRGALGWAVDVARADLAAHHHRSDPRRRRTHLTWALDAQLPTLARRSPSAGHLDVLQADVAAAVAGTTGWCSSSARPAPARRRPCAPPSTTSTVPAVPCSVWHRRRRRPVSSNERPASPPTRSPSCSTNGNATTAHPHDRYQLPAGSTVIVDEAGMVGTASLAALTRLATERDWRLALVGDPVPTPSRRPRRHVPRTLHHRPHPRTRPHPPLHRTMGSSRIPATATRRPASHRHLPRTRPRHRRHPRRTPRRHRQPVARRHQPAARVRSPHRATTTSTPSTPPSRPPASRPATSTPPGPCRSAAASTPTSATSS
jgi:hypothetical protein